MGSGVLISTGEDFEEEKQLPSFGQPFLSPISPREYLVEVLYISSFSCTNIYFFLYQRLIIPVSALNESCVNL